MNGQENAVVQEVLSTIKDSARTEPDKSKILAETYKTLCEAYAVRAKADFEHPSP